MTFAGSDYQPSLDFDRLSTQIQRVYARMSDREWHTIHEIAAAIDAPEASVSAQFRHLRKERFGAHVVESRRRGDTGTFEYRLTPSDVGLLDGKGWEQERTTCPTCHGRGRLPQVAT